MKLDFMKQSKKFFILSVLLVVIALAACLFIGPTTGIAVQGGTQLNYTYTGELSSADIRDAVGPDSFVRFGTLVQSSTLEKGTSTMTISLPGGSTSKNPEKTEFLQTLYPEANIVEVSRNTILPHSNKSLYLNMAIATGVFIVLILLYLAVRFRKIGGWAAGITAIKAMVHNMILLVGIYCLLGIPLDSSGFAFVAATGALSLVGSVIMLDGIRENPSALSSPETLNEGISQQMTPLLKTGIVSVVTLLAGMIVGRGLSLIPMIIGVLLTLYTSFFITVPLWSLFRKKNKSK